MKDDRFVQKLLVGAALGAVVGLAATWIWLNRSDPASLRIRAGGKVARAESISVPEIVGLGMSLMRVARQAGELVRKV